MLRPRPLKIGDSIGLVGASSSTPSDKIELAIKALEMLGLNVIAGESCYASYGYLSGKDDLRAKDINSMFQNPSVAGVFCIRGGYGSARLLDLIDFEMIKSNPKLFIGYSDVTALHIAFNQICKLVTFHGPMPSTELYKGLDSYTMDSYLNNIFTDRPIGLIKAPEGMEIKTLVDGECEGIITGGNLSLITASIGTKYEIDTKGKILFIEEVDEEPYRVDRMLLQLKQAGKLDSAIGIILGYFTNCIAEEPEKSLTLMDIFKELIVPLSKPTIYSFPCGHDLPTVTIPLGAKVRIARGSSGVYFLD
ncbi:LD-carboxypeptidase [Proteiniborus sp. MB09-C3]|uniref:S66 peptidase family protein n=1 Tax=Proteiniborus sp. MB09-C3 TaxID=3050072 RepID=UPI0025546C1B|nr:LD-carboxypeptidase [Proteiniborus sp. MB09-C3]WIV11742.1 LD-carboxypeptidase [Proteiniborus sp. MB09-C3]